jgi:hypothetical protein
MFTRFLPNGNRLFAMKPNGSGKHVVIGQANAGDLDPTIVCDADADTAWIDQPAYGEQADSSCEAVIARDAQNTG